MGKKDLDAGTDIYSFGVMLYEMVVGKVPFSADTPFSIIHDHIYTPLPLPKKVNPNVPETVQRVLLKALAKDRIDRYETTDELVLAFKEAWTEAGIPMQGTAITMHSTNLKTAPMGSQSQSAAPVPVTAAKPEVVKKRSPWIWVGIGAAVLLCFAIAFFAIRNNNRPIRQSAKNTVAPPAPIAQETALPPVQPPPQTTPGNEIPAGGIPPIAPNDSPEVVAAKELVAQNPSDPDARLQLAFAFWDSRQVRPAMDELNQALNLAGPDNTDFFLKAAEDFKARDAWGAAAGIYLRLAPRYPAGNMPEEIKNDLREAVFKSADRKENQVFDLSDRVDAINAPFGHVARGRYALYNGNLKEAKAQLENAKKTEPDMPEALLLQAEIAMKEGNPADAKHILTTLTSDSGVPEWIRFMAENYLKTMQ